MAYQKKRNTKSQPDMAKRKRGVVRKNYHVTSQTAYHIAELALQEKTTEGRIIDKLMRNYLAERGVYHMEHCNKGYE